MFLNFRRKKRLALLKKLQSVIEQDRQVKTVRFLSGTRNRDAGCSQHPASF